MIKFLKENIVMLVFILTSLINSFILVNITCGIFSIRFLICDLCLLLFICSFSYLIKNKSLYFLIFSILLTSICTINSLFYNEYNDFVSIYLFETFFQALKLPSAAITNVFEINDFIFIFQVVIILITIVISKNNKEKSFSRFKKTLVISFTMFVLLILSFTNNYIYRFKNPWNRVYNVKNFGVYLYQTKDIIESINKLFFNNINKDKKEEYVIEYYSNKDKSIDNEYTNIFKDKNVILIHAESVQSMFVDASINGKKIMPNLSKIANGGLYFTNYYSTESVGTSSDTEFTLNNSILPVSQGTVFMNYEDNNYQSTMELLKEKGYYTFSMHGNTCEYWNRNKMYKNLEYDHYYCYEQYDLQDKIGLGLSDKSFFDQSADMIKDIGLEHDKFYGTLIMLTNHTPFYNEGKVDFNVGSLEGSLIGDYIKLLHYVDEAIGEFIDKLDNLELLEDTVIIIYGDHDAKFKTTEYEKYFNYVYNDNKKIDFYEYEDLTKVPLVIWTKDNLVSGKVDKLMSSLDVMPTLANMLDFESEYALGNDIFSVEDNIVVFPNGNFRTEKVYYNAQNNEYKEYEPIDYKYIREKEEYAKKIVEMSNYLVKYNLIKD